MAEPQSSTTTAVLPYVAGVIAIALIAWIGSRYAETVLWPYPVTMVIPAWLLGESILGNIDAGPKLIPLLGALPFLLIGIPLTLRRSKVVWPTLVFIGLVTIGSIAYFAVSWSYGLRYQGVTYVIAITLINVVLAGVSLWLGLRALHVPTYANRFRAALVPCLWFVWCAFPWLGETP